MIRKHVGDQFLLIAQNDHALLSGQMASHFGNSRFARPEPLQETLAAVSMHDCGWPLHDEEPTLNPKGLPLDVFENPLHISLRMWSAAGERLTASSPYTRLLVSIHVLGLSTFPHPADPQNGFELNRFQQAEVERQVELRKQLGFPTDRPLRFGLAMDDTLPAERQLKRNHYILQLMDRLSLGLCCTDLPFPTVENIFPGAADTPLTIHLARTGPASLRLDPWPFDQPRLPMEVPCRAVPARAFGSNDEFQRVFAAAPIQSLPLLLHAS